MALLPLILLALTAAATPLTRRHAPAGVPSFVTAYAPLVYLHSLDAYRPSDIASQLANTQPELNFTLISEIPEPLTLDNLDRLNDAGGEDIYLTSKVDIEQDPTWLRGQTPDASGKTGDAITSAIIVRDRGNGSVDVFYMYFYAYNYGGLNFDLSVGDQANFRFTLDVGNHVGDWEHNVIRFQDGVPQALWYSQHAEGQAFQYKVLQKRGQRPLAYSANGTHAVYATSGTHDHTIPNIDLPNGLLQDYTDKGPLWDPTLSAYYYAYDAAENTFTAYDNSTPVDWLYFNGRWGDQRYPESDPRQEMVLGIEGLAKYGSGPTGPLDKQLNRTQVCPDNGNLCIVRNVLVP